MSRRRQVSELLDKLSQSRVLLSVRGGVVNMIPVLIIGAFALVLKEFPVPAYQAFLQSFLGGFFNEFFNIIYSATFGVLSLYTTYSVSRTYMKITADPTVVSGGAAVASLLVFFILSGSYLPSFGTDSMGPKSMFLAFLSGILASRLYVRLYHRFSHRRQLLFSAGVDREFNRMLTTFFPVAIVGIVFAAANLLVMRVFHVESSRQLLIAMLNTLFAHGNNPFFKGLFFVFSSSLLWFFGIHGSDTLENVMETYFTPGLAENQAKLAIGAMPETILTKGFFDCFVLIGGCGSTLCLLIAILLFSRNRSRRGLALTAALPMLFNINEMMVFGLPIVFNMILLIPFLAVPMICYTVSYLAIASGLVPHVVASVPWTTPIIIGGYAAVESWQGALLQIVNLAIGVVLYGPFVWFLDRKTAESNRRYYDTFMDYFRKNEQDLVSERITEMGTVHGDFAKSLCAELRHGIKKQLMLAYQPQYHYNGKCIGVEALMRFKHPTFGILYPPLVVKLAEEGGFLADLEEAVFLKAMADRPAVLEKFGKDVKISINVTGSSIVTERYQDFCHEVNGYMHFAASNICLEVTEQVAIDFTKETVDALRSLHNIGLKLAIDDFSMGQTSLNYLKNGMFDIIKLDGSLVKELFSENNTREIVASIVKLANSLHMTVLAEYVETAQQREALHAIGCDVYQGYLYSPAVFLEEKK